MAGLGRRTHYRKHLTDSVLHDLPEPSDDERIAKVVGTRGLNQFDVLVANSSSSSSSNEEQQQRDPVLAILPTKFHKLVWVKRNDYVIVQTGVKDDYDRDGDGTEKNTTPTTAATTTTTKNNNKNDKGGIRYMITHILYKDQVKHLKSQNLWPGDDPEFQQDVADDGDGGGGDGGGDQQNYDNKQQQEIDGIVYYDEDENDDLLFVNTNRIARMEIQDSSSSDDSSSDEEEEKEEEEEEKSAEQQELERYDQKKLMLSKMNG